MPANYRIDKSLGVVFTKGEGVLTTQEVLIHSQRLREDPDFDPNYSQLIDVRAVQFVMSIGEVAEIATQEDIFSEQSRRAFVGENNLAFGMSRMLQAYSESSSGEIEVFRDMDEARRWLGLD